MYKNLIFLAGLATGIYLTWKATESARAKAAQHDAHINVFERSLVESEAEEAQRRARMTTEERLDDDLRKARVRSSLRAELGDDIYNEIYGD